MTGTESNYAKRMSAVVFEYYKHPDRHKNGIACDRCGYSDLRALALFNPKTNKLVNSNQSNFEDLPEELEIICYNCYHKSRIETEPVSAGVLKVSIGELKSTTGNEQKLDKQRETSQK